MRMTKTIFAIVIVIMTIFSASFADDLGTQSASESQSNQLQCPLGKEALVVCDENVCITARCELNIECVDKITCAEKMTPTCMAKRCACISDNTLEDSNTTRDRNGTGVYGEEEIPSPLGLECHSQDYSSEDLKDYYDKTSQQLCSVSDAFKEFLGKQPETFVEDYNFNNPQRSEFMGVLSTVEDGIGRAISELVDEESRLTDNMVRFVEINDILDELCEIAEYVCGYECDLCKEASKGVDECACTDQSCCNGLPSEELCGLSTTCVWNKVEDNECYNLKPDDPCNGGFGRCCKVKGEDGKLVNTCFAGATACGVPGGKESNSTNSTDDEGGCCDGLNDGDVCGTTQGTAPGVCVDDMCVAGGQSLISSEMCGDIDNQPCGNNGICCNGQCVIGAVTCTESCRTGVGGCKDQPDETSCGVGGVCCGQTCIESALSCEVGSCDLACNSHSAPYCNQVDCSGYNQTACGTEAGTQGICMWKADDNVVGDDDNDNDGVNRCYKGFTCDSDGDGIVDEVDEDDDNDGIPDEEDDDADGDGVPDNEDRLPGDDQDATSRITRGVRFLDADGEEQECINKCSHECVWKATCQNDTLLDCVNTCGCGVATAIVEEISREETPSEEELDFDGDGVLRCESNETCDSDGDGQLDLNDTDDDNDGILDEDDDDKDGDGTFDIYDLLPGDDDDFTFIDWITDDDFDCSVSCGPEGAFCDQSLLDTNTTGGNETDPDGDGNAGGCVNVCIQKAETKTSYNSTENSTSYACHATCPRDLNNSISKCEDWSNQCVAFIHQYFDTLYLLQKTGVLVVNNIRTIVDYAQENDTIVKISDGVPDTDGNGTYTYTDENGTIYYDENETETESSGGAAVVAASDTEGMDIRDVIPGLIYANEPFGGTKPENELQEYVTNVVQTFSQGESNMANNASDVVSNLEELSKYIDKNMNDLLKQMETIAMGNCGIADALGCKEGVDAFQHAPLDGFKASDFWRDFKDRLLGSFGTYLEEDSLDATTNVVDEGGAKVLSTKHRGLPNEIIEFRQNTQILPEKIQVSISIEGGSGSFDGELAFPSLNEANSSVVFNESGVTVRYTRYSFIVQWTEGQCDGCEAKISVSNASEQIWWVYDLGRLSTTVKGFPEKVREERAREWARQAPVANVNEQDDILLKEPEAFSLFMSRVFGHACYLAQGNVERLNNDPNLAQEDLFDVSIPFSELELLPERESDILGQLFVTWSQGTALPSLVTYGDPIISQEDQDRQTRAVEATREMLQHMCIQNINRGEFTQAVEEQDEAPVEAITDFVWAFDCSEITDKELCGIGESETYCQWDEALEECVPLITIDALHIIGLEEVKPEDQTDQCEPNSSIVCLDFIVEEYDTATYVSPSCMTSIMVKLGLGDEYCTNIDGIEQLMLDRNCTKGSVINCFEGELGVPEITKERGNIWMVDCGDMNIAPSEAELNDTSIPSCESYDVEILQNPEGDVISGGETVSFRVNVNDTSLTEGCKAREVSIWSDAPLEKEDEAACAIIKTPARSDTHWLEKGGSIEEQIDVMAFYRSGQCRLVIHVEDGGQMEKEYLFSVAYDDVSPFDCEEGEVYDDKTGVCCIEGETCCKTTNDCFDSGICVDDQFIPSMCGKDHYCISDLDVAKVIKCSDENKLCNPEGTKCVDPNEINIQFKINVLTQVQENYRVGSQMKIIVGIVDEYSEHLSGANVVLTSTDTDNKVTLTEDTASNTYTGSVQFGENVGDYAIIIEASKNDESVMFQKEISLYDFMTLSFEASPLVVEAGGVMALSDVIVSDSKENVLEHYLLKAFIGETELTIDQDSITLPAEISPGVHTLKLCGLKNHYKPDVSCIATNGFCCKAKALDVYEGETFKLSLLVEDIVKVGEDIPVMLNYPGKDGSVACVANDEEKTCTLENEACSLVFKGKNPGDLLIECLKEGTTAKKYVNVFDVITSVSFSKEIDSAAPGDEIEITKVETLAGPLDNYDAHWIVDGKTISSHKITLPQDFGQHTIVVKIGAINVAEYTKSWTTSVKAIYSYGISVTPDKQTTLPQGSAEYVVTIENQGNVEQTFNIDSNDLDVAEKVVKILPGDKKDVLLSISGVDAAKELKATVKGVKETKTINAFVDISEDAIRSVDMKLNLDKEELEINKGTAVVGYELWNTGNVKDTYKVSTAGINLGEEIITVDGNSFVKNEYPVSFSSPGLYTVTFTAISTEDSSISVSKSAEILVFSYEYEVSPLKIDLSGKMGDRLEFSFKVKNTGFKADTFKITTKSPEITLLNNFVTLEPGEEGEVKGKTTLKYDVVSKVIVTSESNKAETSVSVNVELTASFSLDMVDESLNIERESTVDMKIGIMNKANAPITLNLKLTLPEGRENLFEWTQKKVELAANEKQILINKITTFADTELGEVSITIVGKNGKEMKWKEFTLNVVADITAIKTSIANFEQELDLVGKELNEITKNDVDPVSAEIAYESAKISMNDLKKEFEEGNYDAVKNKLEKARRSLEKSRTELNTAKKLTNVSGMKSKSSAPIIGALVLVSLLVVVAMKKRAK